MFAQLKIRIKKIEELSRKQNDPKTKAKEFANTIVESEEYKNFIKFNKELEKNQTAQNLLREFQQKQRELQGLWFDPDTLEQLKNL